MKKLPDTSSEILDEFKQLAKYYLPSWEYSEGGMISALAEVFSEMTEENRRLIPRIADRHYMLYLSMLGLEKKSAEPAVGYVRVIPTAENTVHIPEGTRLGSENAEFVTTSEAYANGAALKAIFCSERKKVCRSKDLFDFSGGNISETYLCMSAGNLFVSEGAFRCKCTLYDIARADQHRVAPPAELDPKKIRWEYLCADGFKSVTSVSYDKGCFTLSFEECIPLCEYGGKIGRWVRAVFLGETIMPAFSINSALFFANEETISAQSLYLNDEMLPDSALLPFGREPTEYDAFYIRSDECLSKNGSTVTIKAELSFEDFAEDNSGEDEVEWKNVIPASRLRPKPPSVKQIENAVWEYWNGIGWSRIYRDDSHTEDFRGGDSRTIIVSFTCPEDISPTSVGADEGLFIRCRIQNMTAGYAARMIYRLPRINSLSVSFAYDGGIHPEAAFLHHRAKTTELSSAEYCLSRTELLSRSYTYLCFDRPLSLGYTNVFFKLKGNSFDGKELMWEACFPHNGKVEWREINTSDKTSGLTESGIITFGITKPLAQTDLFGENGWWLRASAVSIQNSCPVESICTDVVPVVQIMKMPEMTVTYTGNPILLAQGGVCDCNVSVLFSEGWRSVSKQDYSIRLQEGEIIFDKGFAVKKTGEPNVRINYSVTMGSGGNVPADSINFFLDPVPFVDSVSNIEKTFGGRDSETTEECVARGRDKLRSLERCVSAPDYVSAARNADSSVKKARCFSDGGGKITIVVLTEDYDASSFRLVEKKVRESITKNMPFYMRNGLSVIHAEYIEITVSANVLSDGGAYPQTIHADIASRLKAYFDPQRGDVSGTGFDIGSYPDAESIRRVILSAQHVCEIESINLVCRCGNSVFDFDRISEIAYGVPIAAEPQINIREKKILI